jgi:hypothetical protein
MIANSSLLALLFVLTLFWIVSLCDTSNLAVRCISRRQLLLIDCLSKNSLVKWSSEHLPSNYLPHRLTARCPNCRLMTLLKFLISYWCIGCKLLTVAVGTLMYSLNSRPDLTHAVRQVARCIHNPGPAHAKALDPVSHYLAGLTIFV